MRVKIAYAISIAILASLAALRASCPAGDPGTDEVWTTKKVMDKVAAGKQSLLALVNRDLRKTGPDWKSDGERLAEIIRLMSMLTRQKPPRGSQQDWDKLVREYVDGVKAARQDIRERRLQPARAALEKARLKCDECHENHGIQ